MTRILTIIALLFATPAWAETVLYCQDELATGIIKKDGRWTEAKFALRRHTVKFDEEKMTLVGVGSFPMECKLAFPVILRNDVYCSNFALQTFIFNK